MRSGHRGRSRLRYRNRLRMRHSSLPTRVSRLLQTCVKIPVMLAVISSSKAVVKYRGYRQ